MLARPTRPPLLARGAARLVTGPAAFLLAGLLDWVALSSRCLYARARGRRVDWHLD